MKTFELLEKIAKIVESTPHDQDLGQKVRALKLKEIVENGSLRGNLFIGEKDENDNPRECHVCLHRKIGGDCRQDKFEDKYFVKNLFHRPTEFVLPDILDEKTVSHYCPCFKYCTW